MAPPAPPALVAPAAPAHQWSIGRSRREWIAFGGLLLLTAVMYLWALDKSGWANSFYSAAVQAGSESWKAFLFGASDAAGSITVDKPPASLWIMSLSVRIFGLSSWAMLAPQALMGVGAVATVYASVRRRFSPWAAWSAGIILALTPVAALMFKFNNPDALLVLLMAVAAYFTLRAVEEGRTRWMVLAGVLIGFGFLTKQLQAFLVLPGFAVAYLIGAPISLGKRIRDGLFAVGAMIVSAGWWVALVELWPESSRPYIGGSQNNSFLELTFGYNGLGRITGDETGSVGGGGGGMGGGAWGETGIGRLFNSEIGGQIAWLLPAALLATVVGLVLTFRSRRTSATRAGFIVWGGWLVTTVVVFSFMAGIFHAYYTVALAPAIAALVPMGTELLWRRRQTLWAMPLLAAGVAASTVWAYVLLNRTPDWNPWLRWVVVGLGVVATALLLGAKFLPATIARLGLVVALLTVLAGPAAYSLQSINTGHTGSIVTAGPVSAMGMGGGRMGGGPGGQGGGGFPGGQNGQNGTQNGTGQNGTGQMPGGQNNGNFTPPNMGQMPSGTGQNGTGQNGGTTQDGTGIQDGTGQQNGMGQMPGATGQNGTQGGGQMPTGGGGMGGLLDATTPSDELKAVLMQDADQYTWIAATVGAQNAAGYQLATEKSVMPIGGFNGSDPSPTLEQFKAYVAEGKIHYYIGQGSGGGMGGPGGTGSNEIATWVAENFTATTVDGTTLYDLTSPSSSSTSTTDDSTATDA